MLLVRDLTLHIKNTADERQALEAELVRRLRIPPEELLSFRILKESVDARKKEDIHFSYQLLVSLKKEEAFLRKHPDLPGVTPHYKEVIQAVEPGEETMGGRILIVGFGPAGMFGALTLARAGYRPLIVERGQDMVARTASVESFWRDGSLNPAGNVQFGEGGAGTFSDGKLTTRIKDARVNQVLDAFTQAGAPEEILYRNKPHVGTDLLKGVVLNIRREIETLGGEFRFSTQLEDLEAELGSLKKVRISGEWIPVSAVLLCPGHSARDTYAMLQSRGVALESKAFAVGLRVEHLQEQMDSNQYGPWASHPKLRASEYTLAAKTSDGRGVYSFCMCPGGRVVNASSEEGHLCVNGMSYHARSLLNANSAIVVSVTPEDFGPGLMDGIAFQRGLEKKAFEMGGGNWHAPVQLTQDFLNDRISRDLTTVLPSITPGFRLAPLHELLPQRVTQGIKDGMLSFGRKIPGFDKTGIFTGVESRTSSPLRILRREDYQSISHQGLYPCGEGAGYAGGIVSAAVDGIKAAEAVIRRFRPV